MPTVQFRQTQDLDPPGTDAQVGVATDPLPPYTHAPEQPAKEPVMRIEMQDVSSSQIHSIGHDPETNTLAIRFYTGWGEKKKVGSLYHYQNFTAKDFKAFKEAESLGKHFGTNIKPFDDKYPYTKIVEDDAPTAA